MYNDIVCFTSNNFYTPKQEEEMDKSKKFLIKINEEINVLIMKSPPIDPTIALFFHKKFKDHKINLPELNGIETNRNSPSRGTSETASDKDETVIELRDYHLM